MKFGQILVCSMLYVIEYIPFCYNFPLQLKDFFVSLEEKCIYKSFLIVGKGIQPPPPGFLDQPPPPFLRLPPF